MQAHCLLKQTIGLIISAIALAMSSVSFASVYERNCHSYYNGYYCHSYYHRYNNHYYYHHHYYHDNNNFAAGLVLGGILGAIASSNQMQPNMPYTQQPNCSRVLIKHIYHYPDHQRIVREGYRTVCN